MRASASLSALAEQKLARAATDHRQAEPAHALPTRPAVTNGMCLRGSTSASTLHPCGMGHLGARPFERRGQTAILPPKSTLGAAPARACWSQPASSLHVSISGPSAETITYPSSEIAEICSARPNTSAATHAATPLAAGAATNENQALAKAHYQQLRSMQQYERERAASALSELQEQVRLLEAKARDLEAQLQEERRARRRQQEASGSAVERSDANDETRQSLAREQRSSALLREQVKELQQQLQKTNKQLRESTAQLAASHKRRHAFEEAIRAARAIVARSTAAMRAELSAMRKACDAAVGALVVAVQEAKTSLADTLPPKSNRAPVDATDVARAIFDRMLAKGLTERHARMLIGGFAADIPSPMPKAAIVRGQRMAERQSRQANGHEQDRHVDLRSGEESDEEEEVHVPHRFHR